MTITISNLTVADNVPAGTAVGVLTAWSAGTQVPCNFTLTKGSAGYFAISGNSLVTSWSGSITPGFYAVRVHATGTNTGFSGRASFTITVTAATAPPPPPPPPANALLADTNEPLLVDTGIETLVQ